MAETPEHPDIHATYIHTWGYLTYVLIIQEAWQTDIPLIEKISNRPYSNEKMGAVSVYHTAYVDCIRPHLGLSGERYSS